MRWEEVFISRSLLPFPASMRCCCSRVGKDDIFHLRNDFIEMRTENCDQKWGAHPLCSYAAQNVSSYERRKNNIFRGGKKKAPCLWTTSKGILPKKIR